MTLGPKDINMHQLLPVTDQERRDYPGMVTPTELRNLALGLENANHASEQIAALFRRAPLMHKALSTIAEKACYCARGVHGERLGLRCDVCEARHALNDPIVHHAAAE